MNDDPRRWLYAVRLVAKLTHTVGDLVLGVMWRGAVIVTLFYVTDWVIFITSTKLR